MADQTNVIAGSGALYLAIKGTTLPTLTALPVDWSDFDSPGYTDDGVEFVYTPTYKDITVDEEMSPVNQLLTAEKLEIKVKLAEATLENLNRAIAASSLDTGVTGVETVYFGSAAQSSIQEFILGFEGPAPGTNQTRVILAYRAKVVGAVSLKYQRTDKVVYDVTFACLADSTKTAGKRLGQVTDFLAAGS